MQMDEHEEYWRIAPEDATVTRVAFDWAVTVQVSGASTSFEARIESTFVLRGPDGTESVIDPEGGPAQLAPGLLLLHMGVDHVHAFKDGRLDIGLTGGACVHVDASDEFEPWELTSPEKTRIVSTPAKELAIWRG
ncbi:DUF6188 family protein [Streptomyces sp. DW26H14]|uniref:DUF6188 family protein n=1 Tax=Streptomyces sp. DW26H14 TaxID=3435395 RepID=UPI00403DE9B3